MEFTQEHIDIIYNKCPKCGAQLNYCKGKTGYKDYLRCPNHEKMNCPNHPAEYVIMLMRKYISQNKS